MSLNHKLIVFRQDLANHLRRLDIFATRGVHPRYHQGLRMFWWDSLLATISSAFVDAYTTLYMLALGATSTQIGLLSSASNFMGMLAPLPGAALVKRVGRRRPLIVNVSIVFRVLILLAALLPFFFKGQTAIYVLLIFFALRTGLNNLLHPAWVSMTGDVVPMEHRGRYFSARNVSMAIASMLIVPFAGWLIGRIGSPQGYQVSLTLAFAVGIASSYAYSRIPEPPMSTPAARPRAVHPLAALREAFHTSKVFVYFVAGMMVWTFGVQIAGPYFSVYQVDVLETPPAVIGMLSTISALTDICGQRFWGRIIDRRGSRWVMGLSAFIIPVLPLIWIFVRHPWQAAWVSVPSGFFWAAFNIASFNLLLELPGAEQRTQAAASHATLLSLVSVVAPLVGSFVVEHLGFHWVFALSGAGRMIGAVMFLMLLKPFAKKRQEPGAKMQEELENPESRIMNQESDTENLASSIEPQEAASS